MDIDRYWLVFLDIDRYLWILVGLEDVLVGCSNRHFIEVRILQFE